MQVDVLTEEQPEAIRTKLLPALIKGVASHHAGHLPGWKSLVERLFQRWVMGSCALGVVCDASGT